MILWDVRACRGGRGRKKENDMSLREIIIMSLFIKWNLTEDESQDIAISFPPEHLSMGIPSAVEQHESELMI